MSADRQPREAAPVKRLGQKNKKTGRLPLSEQTTLCLPNATAADQLSLLTTATFPLNDVQLRIERGFGPCPLQTLLIRTLARHRVCRRRAAKRAHAKDLVETDGIEPTTSCLQSTRSPN